MMESEWWVSRAPSWVGLSVACGMESRWGKTDARKTIRKLLRHSRQEMMRSTTGAWTVSQYAGQKQGHLVHEV